MDIKLRARLSAYSKIESINGLTSNTPVPDATAAGSVLGVNNSGNYTLFPTVSTAEIDNLFGDVGTDDIVTKEEIDTLFPDEQVKDEPVSKDQIDTLFKEEEPEITTVSFADIDALFK